MGRAGITTMSERRGDPDDHGDRDDHKDHETRDSK
jgi:hypothetical protein